MSDEKLVAIIRIITDDSDGDFKDCCGYLRFNVLHVLLNEKSTECAGERLHLIIYSTHLIEPTKRYLLGRAPGQGASTVIMSLSTSS